MKFNKEKDLKSIKFQQSPETIQGFFNISTKDNINLSLPRLLGTTTFSSGIIANVNPIVGYTNGIPNGSQVQIIGDALWEINFKGTLPQNYPHLRNKLVKLFASGESFAFKSYTTQTQQSVPTLMPNAKGKNYFLVKAIQYTFYDVYEGSVGAAGLELKMQALPFPIVRRNKLSLSEALTSAAGLFAILNALDEYQTIAADAALQINQVGNALGEIARGIASFGSGVWDLIAEVNNLKVQVGTLIKSPLKLIDNMKRIAKAFARIFSSGDKTVKNKYISNLVNGFDKTKVKANGTTVQPSGATVQTNGTTASTTASSVNPPKLAFASEANGNKLYLYNNIIQNNIDGRSVQFLRMVIATTVASIYQTYTFNTIEEARDGFLKLQSMYFDIISDETFRVSINETGLPPVFTQPSLSPEAFLTFETFILQALESIREQMYQIVPYKTIDIREKTTLFHFVANQYGSLDYIDEIAAINDITDYFTIFNNTTLKIK